MSDFLAKAEEVLAPEAENLVPEGSTTTAVVHQWLHALAYEKTLFSEKRISRQHLLSKMADRGLYEPSEQLKSQLSEPLQLTPSSHPKFTFIDLFAGIGGFRLVLLGSGVMGGACK